MLPKNAVCAEVGTWKGDFAEVILRLSKPVKLYLIDPWQYFPEFRESWYGAPDGSQAQMDAVHDGVARRFQGRIRQGQVEMVRALSQEAAAKIPDASLDWVYIDGNHAYEFVSQDLQLYFPKIKPGGYLAGDDYAEGGWWQGGVQRAVDEFLEANRGKVRLEEIRNRQYVLKKITAE